MENELNEIFSSHGKTFHGKGCERLKQYCLSYMKINSYIDLTIRGLLPEAVSRQVAGIYQLVDKLFLFLEYAARNILTTPVQPKGGGVEQRSLLKLSRKLQQFTQRNEVRHHTL